MQQAYSQQLLQHELLAGEIQQEAPAQGREMADMEYAQSRQQQILEQLQQLMMENQQYQQQVMRREAPSVDMSKMAAGPTYRMPVQQMQTVQQQPRKAAAPNFDTMSFSKAFGTARKAKMKTFKWKGKMYTTDMYYPNE